MIKISVVAATWSTRVRVFQFALLSLHWYTVASSKAFVPAKCQLVKDMGVNGKESHLVVSSNRGWYHFDLHPNLIWKGKEFCIRHYSFYAQIPSPYTPLLLPVPIIFNAFIYPLKIKSLRMCDVAIIHLRHKHFVDCYRILPLLGLNRVLDFRRISEDF